MNPSYQCWSERDMNGFPIIFTIMQAIMVALTAANKTELLNAGAAVSSSKPCPLNKNSTRMQVYGLYSSRSCANRFAQLRNSNFQMGWNFSKTVHQFGVADRQAGFLADPNN